MGVYVDVTGVSDEFLSFMGYVLVAEDANNKIYEKKGEIYILPKKGRRSLYVDDFNDVPYFQAHRRTPAPPWDPV